MKTRMNWKKNCFRVLSLVMTLIIVSLTFLPSLDIKAYETRDKNGNISLTATGDIKINLLVAAIDPTLTSLDNKNFHNGKKKIKASEYFYNSLDDSLSFWCDTFEEVSHNRVDINVVDTIIIDEFPKYINEKVSLTNKTYQEYFPKDENGCPTWSPEALSDEYSDYYDTAGELDYDYYIDKLDLVKRKNNNEFDMVFLIGIDPLSPCETCMVGRSPVYVNGTCFERECDNFVIVTPTFSRKDGSIENMGHLAEHMLGYTYGMIDYEPRHVIDGSDYMALNDWQKFSLCKLMGTTDTEVYGYGLVHYSPNSTTDYDWENNTKVKYYKNWREGKDIQYFTADTTYLADGSRFNYYNDGCISHHKWWFYNMPYEDGRDKDGYYNNWWRYIFNPNYVTDITTDDSYPGSVIMMNVGDENPLKFKVIENSGNMFTTDAASTSAAVEINDDSIVSFKNGKIIALKKGITEVFVKIDGKTAMYTVSVGEPYQKAQVTAFVKRFYKEVLGRSWQDINADTNGINDWVTKLINGTEDGSNVAYGFVYSPEFQNKKVSNEDYVLTLYKSFFNRDPFDPNNLDENSYNDWVNKLKNGTDRLDVLAGFTNSPEFKNLCSLYGINSGTLDPASKKNPGKQNNNPQPANKPKELKLDTSKVDQKKLEQFVYDLYTSALGREGEAGGVEYWEGCIINGQDADGRVYTISTVISKGFFLSPEYTNMNKSDEDFVLDCYAAFFARSPLGTDDEVNYWNWVSKLKKGEITRQEMIEVGFGYSPEFKNLLTNEYGFVIIN